MKRKYYSVVPAGSGKLLFSHWAAGSIISINLKNLCLFALACLGGGATFPLSSASAIPLDAISGVSFCSPRLIIPSPPHGTVPSSAFTDTSVFAVLPFLLCTRCLWVQPPPISAGCPVSPTCSVGSHITTMSMSYLRLGAGRYHSLPWRSAP